MISDDKLKKLKGNTSTVYQPPKVMKLNMNDGFGDCIDGSGVSGYCSGGTGPAIACWNGNSDDTDCTEGNNATPLCNSQGSSATSCLSGFAGGL